MEEQNYYPALRTITTILKIVAICVGVVGLYGIQLFWKTMGDVNDGESKHLLTTIIIVFCGIIILFIVAAAESIILFIDIEANTQKTKLFMEALINKMVTPAVQISDINSINVIKSLQELKKLLDDGILTQDEFNKEKQKVLRG